MSNPLPILVSVAVVALQKPEWRVVAANGAFLKMTGFSRKDAVGATLRSLHLIVDGHEEMAPEETRVLTWRLPSGGVRRTLSRLHVAGTETETLEVLINVDLTELMPEDEREGVRRAERAYLGRVFHDTVTQEIGAAGFLVEILKRREMTPEVRAQVERLAETLKRCTVAGSDFARLLKAGRR